jgi:hypothetical protein
MRQFRFALPVALMLSCDKPVCKNDNVVFDSNKPNTAMYNEELVTQMYSNGEAKLHYWVVDYTVNDKDSFLILEAQGEDLCAYLWLDVSSRGDGKLNNLIGKHAQGYKGAELKGLNYDVVQANGQYRFVYKSLGWIND